MDQINSPHAEQFRRNLLEWAEYNHRDYPWRDVDASLYDVFVAEFFLTQTPADNVAEVFPQFLERFLALAALDEAEQSEIESTIEPLGFQRMRSEALNEIAATHDSLPREPEA